MSAVLFALSTIYAHVYFSNEVLPQFTLLLCSMNVYVRLSVCVCFRAGFDAVLISFDAILCVCVF